MDGAFVEMARLSGSGPPPRLVGVLSSDDLVGVELKPPPMEEPVGTRATLDETFVRIGRDGRAGDTIATFTGDEIELIRSPDGRPGYGSSFTGFAPGTAYTTGNGLLYHGLSDRQEIRVVRPGDGVVRLIRWGEGLSPLTREMIGAHEDSWRSLAAERGPDAVADVERQFLNARYPDHIPAFDWLLVDRVGNLWVRSYPRPGESETTWSVFDPDGGWLVDLSLPLVGMGRPAVFDIGADYVLFREEDEAGLQYFARYELVKGAS